MGCASPNSEVRTRVSCRLDVGALARLTRLSALQFGGRRSGRVFLWVEARRPRLGRPRPTRPVRRCARRSASSSAPLVRSAVSCSAGPLLRTGVPGALFKLGLTSGFARAVVQLPRDQSLAIVASYFFRLSTAAARLMNTWRRRIDDLPPTLWRSYSHIVGIRATLSPSIPRTCTPSSIPITGTPSCPRQLDIC